MTIETSTLLELDKIIQGDSLTALKSLPDSCINLVFTSSPYADNRRNTYKGVLILKNTSIGFCRYLPN